MVQEISDHKNFDKARLGWLQTMDSKAVLQTIEANLVSNTQESIG